jgi:hypothetical protein
MSAANLFVEVNYENGSMVIIESVGPYSAIGFVKDAVLGHFTETNGQRIKDIRVGTKLAPGPTIGPRVGLD